MPKHPSGSFLRELALVTVALLWCLTLWAARVQFTGSERFFYLLYNLALAVIPLGFSSAMVHLRVARIRWFLFPLWLLFFPNAPYLLTDLIHLRPTEESPLWFDWLFILSCALTGAIIGLVSLRQVHRILEIRFGPERAWIAITLIFPLTAFGIYLGRFPRWNSWDLLTRPGKVMSQIGDLLLHPLDHPRMVAYTLGVTVLLALGYLVTLTGSITNPRGAPASASTPESQKSTPLPGSFPARPPRTTSGGCRERESRIPSAGA